MNKNYNDQPDLLDAQKGSQPQQVEIEGEVYHKLSKAELEALKAQQSGDLLAREVKRKEAIEAGWNYVQLTQSPDGLFQMSRKCGEKALRLFLYMIRHIGKDNNALMVTQSHLSRACDMHVSSVKRGINELERAKILTTVKVGKGTIYVFNAQFVWKGEVKKRPYAFFNANIIADYDEQDEAIKEYWNNTSLEGGTPLNGKRNAELITEKLQEKATQKRRDLVMHLISHQIDPSGHIDFEDQKDLATYWDMPMNISDERWGPVKETFKGVMRKEPWALEFMGLNDYKIEH